MTTKRDPGVARIIDAMASLRHLGRLCVRVEPDGKLTVLIEDIAGRVLWNLGPYALKAGQKITFKFPQPE